jgi:hypothetical protein
LAKASPGNCLLRASPRPGGQQLAPRTQRDRSDSTNLPVANILISAPRPKAGARSVLGQTRTSASLNGTSVLHSTADVVGPPQHVRVVPTTDLCTAAIASFIQSPRSARASSEGGMVSPTSPDMRVTYLDATEHPGTVQEYKIMSAPGIVISTVNWLILGASATLSNQDWT